MRQYLHLSVVGLCLSVGSTHAAFFSATNSADSGPGSLRQAIIDANAVGGTTANTISFSGATFPLIIQLSSALPPITGPVDIFGAGAVEIRGSGGVGLDVRGGNSTITELTINGCSTALVLRDKGTNTVKGCYLGTDLSGSNAVPNGVGLQIINSSANRIQGFGDPGVISGNSSDGIRVEGTSTGNVFTDQRIGTDVSGTHPLPNGGNGLHVVNAGTTAMGTCVVSANKLNGILIENSGRFAPQDSMIGTDLSGTVGMGNELSGIVIDNTPSCGIGSSGVSPMVISDNGHYGVEILGAASISNQVGFGTVFIGAGLQTNALGNGLGGILIDGASGNIVDGTSLNRIHIGFNHGPGVSILNATNINIGTRVSFRNNTGLGIDLGDNGPTLNDVCDNDGGANHQLNYPVITQVTSTNVMGTFNSTASTIFTVELYASSGCDQGHTLLGSELMITSGSCTDTFSINIPAQPPGTLITARTRHNPAFDLYKQNVSEFSPCAVGSELVGLEVVQSVQDWNNSVPLIAGKTTYVRAHIEDQRPETNYVTGVLRGFRGGGELPGPLTPINYGGRIIPSKNAAQARGHFGSSLIFYLPPDWVDGTVELRLDAPGIICREAAGTPTDCSATVTFNPVPIPEVTYVPLQWADDFGFTYKPSNEDISYMANQVLAMYPIHGINYFIGAVVPFGSGTPTDDDLARFNLYLERRRANDGCLGNCKRLYYGVVKGVETGGLASDLPGNTSSGSINDDRFGYASGRDAHEMGHSLGRQHAVTDTLNVDGNKVGVCGEVADPTAPKFPFLFQIDGQMRATLGPMDSGEDAKIFGLDANALNRLRVVDPTKTFELLSYCEGIEQGRRWPSSFTYDGIREAINNRFGGTGAVAAVTGGAVQDYLLVSGTVDLNTGAAAFEPFGTISSAEVPPLPAPGDYSLQLLDGASNVVTEVLFQLTVSEPDAPAAKSTVGTFLILVPDDPSFQQAVIRHDGQIVATRTASANPPTVQVVSPNGGENIQGNPVVFQWTASDLDGDALKYLVQYSADGGGTWETLALDLIHQTYQADAELLKGSANALIRVQASDGFHTATDTSNAAFTKSNHKPQASILKPTEQELFTGQQQVIFEGMALDVEDGTLPDSNVQWASNLDGALGTGTLINMAATDLAEGTHLITMIATDSQASSTTATVHIVVARAIPAALADLSVQKATSEAAVGSNLTYTVTVANNGPNGATGVTLTDTLPATFNFVSADESQGNCVLASGILTCQLGSLAAGSNAVVSIVGTPTTGGVLTNSAAVVANETDPAPANNTATTATIVSGTGTAATFPPGDVNANNTVTGADSLLINQVLVGLRSSNDAVFATAGFANGDVNTNNVVNGADSLLINQEIVGLRSYVVTKIVPGSHSSSQTTPVTIFGIGFPTNVVPSVSIGAPVNLTLTNVVVVNREKITATVPAGGGLGTGTVNVVSSPTNGVISFGRFINQ